MTPAEIERRQRRGADGANLLSVRSAVIVAGARSSAEGAAKVDAAALSAQRLVTQLRGR